MGTQIELSRENNIWGQRCVWREKVSVKRSHLVAFVDTKYDKRYRALLVPLSDRLRQALSRCNTGRMKSDSLG